MTPFTDDADRDRDLDEGPDSPAAHEASIVQNAVTLEERAKKILTGQVKLTGNHAPDAIATKLLTAASKFRAQAAALASARVERIRGDRDRAERFAANRASK